MEHRKPTSDELDNRFRYHPPKGDQPTRYEFVRLACRDLARKIVDNSPCSPEQTRALGYLDLVMMLSNAAIARNEPGD